MIRKIEVVFADDSPGSQLQLDKSVPFVSDKHDTREARWVVDDVVPREGDFRAQVHGHFLRRTQQSFHYEFQFESDHRYGILPAIVVLNGV